MVDNSNQYSDKAAIEQQILVMAERIIWPHGADCFEAEPIDSFILAWIDLQMYYKNHRDSTISVEVVREYVQNLERFEGAMNNPAISEDCRTLALDAYYELKVQMKEILRAVDRWLYPNGR